MLMLTSLPFSLNKEKKFVGKRQHRVPHAHAQIHGANAKDLFFLVLLILMLLRRMLRIKSLAKSLFIWASRIIHNPRPHHSPVCLIPNRIINISSLSPSHLFQQDFLNFDYKSGFPYIAKWAFHIYLQ
jgi:hypothetical protein